MHNKTNQTMFTDSTLLQAVKSIHYAEAILITAGAGMGVDSGLPDFRGNKGFWRAYPPFARMGLSFTQLANPEWFNRDPGLAWGFYGHRLNLYRRTQPHAGFYQLLEIVKQKKGNYFVFTSNVDGHFLKAGFDPAKLVECHGSIHHLQCARPCQKTIWSADNLNITVREKDFRATGNMPTCINCGQMARPNILMFGDWSWLAGRTQEQEYRFSNWIDSILENNLRLVIIEIGAGQAVATVRMTSEQIAGMCNAMLVRINPRDDQVPTGHISLHCRAAEGIDRIYRILNKVYQS